MHLGGSNAASSKMKFLLVAAAAVLAVASAVPLSEDETLLKEWADFKDTHGKSYEHEEEEARRFKIFSTNRDFISQHNARHEKGEETYTVAMNHFGDMHNDEFRSMMNGYRRGNRNRTATRTHQNSGSTVPTSLDWRDYGYVTAIKDQGSCGSCWAFSTTGSLEGQLYAKTGKLVSLSEQNLIDCSYEQGNEGCDGGLMDDAFTYVETNMGIDTEASYPYEDSDGSSCQYSASNSAGYNTGYVDVTSGSETDLLDAVATVGPVSVAIDAGLLGFQFYSGGIYSSWFCSTTDLDHGVLVIGYGSQKTWLSGTKKYWLMKNSWGTSWGIKGYFKLLRDHNNECGVASEASYPVV